MTRLDDDCIRLILRALADNASPENRRAAICAVTSAYSNPAPYVIPISPTSNIRISGPFPVSSEEWSRFITVLDTMKPDIVKEEKMSCQLGEITPKIPTAGVDGSP